MDRHHAALTIMKRELRAYFISPIAYIVITVFLLFTGFFFFKDFFYFNQAEMRGFFQLLPLTLIFVVPAITMRYFSEEMQSGSFEILMTMPVETVDVVIGKFLAGTISVAIMISPTLVYLITLLIVGSPDIGMVIGGYLGAILLAAAYVSIGIFASSLSKNQIIAFIVALSINFLFWIIDKITIFLPSSLNGLAGFGTDYHFQNIAKGIIDSRDIIFFLTIIVISTLLTAKILEERR